MLSEVGLVQAVVVNERTGHLIDGHLRVSLALRSGQPTVPVIYVDLSPADEALVLATLDPIGAMAAADAAKLDDLLRQVTTGEAAVQALLGDLAARVGDIPIADGPATGDDLAEDPHPLPMETGASAWLVIPLHCQESDMPALRMLLNRDDDAPIDPSCDGDAILAWLRNWAAEANSETEHAR